MPRGNDAQAAAAEFRGQYGVLGNAEDLIQANRAAYPSDLRAAQLAPPRPDAKDELDMSHEDVGSHLGVENGRVLDWNVRGENIVAVVETESGHVYKTVTPLSSVGGGPQGSGDDEDEDDPEVIRSQAEAQATGILAQARLEAEQIIQEAVQEAQAKASERAQERAAEADKVREEASQRIEKSSESGGAGAGAERGDASEQEKRVAKGQREAQRREGEAGGGLSTGKPADKS